MDPPSHGRPRRLSVLAVVFMLLMVPTAAHAGEGTGNFTGHASPHPGNGYAVWTTTTNQVQVDAYPATLASGYCTDEWFDWSRDGNHLDARVARSCYPGTRRTSNYNTENLDVGVMQKGGTCYGPNDNTTNPISKCAQDPRHDYDIPANSALPSTCIRGWELTSTAVYAYYDGGSQTSCTS
ncbi:hypothetical protein F4553_000098 [Allocatelliglobosispora scoriae]|uniref:Secreted protein n=1 Tax=Allocatelliglobosispora scoriae TaxID=643052 RepID=A0A841BHR1_9ACTN|nr:hypothetical protein [Allocatelliglobosispora scoriae]MBB5866719.1 hypothetical protein [Allocatelliglobosispora scoriae]